jgi:apolipoprotein N-acyltransferase
MAGTAAGDTAWGGLARLRRYGLPLLSGLLIGTSYIPFPPWALLFCHVPLWIFWMREGSVRKVLWGGFLAQFLFCLVGFHWVAYTAHEFGQMPWPVAVGVLFLFCAFGHLYLVLSGFLWAILRDRLRLTRTQQILLLPTVTALCHRYVPMIFPWNLGYPWLFSRLPAFQLAEFVGFEGLGVLTLYLNLSLLIAWERRKERTGAWLLGGAVVFLILINAAGWAVGRGQPPPDAQARVLVVQGNVGNLEKVYAEKGLGFRDEIVGRYFRLTRQGISRADSIAPDFAVWPETAFPEVIRTDRLHAGYTGVLGQFVRSMGVPLVTGAVGYDAAGGKPTNAMFFFDREGRLPEPPYRKVHLLAFGEYVPLAGRFPVVKEWFPWLADFSRGPGPEVRKAGGVVVGPQICYEGLFPDFSRGLAARGARIFVNVTNDSWFGAPAEPSQHLWMTLARGIEFRRPVVRATNTGISAAMGADGVPLGGSPIGEEWHGVYTVPYRTDPSPTFYQRVGYGVVPAVLWLYLLAVLAAAGRPGRRG